MSAVPGIFNNRPHEGVELLRSRGIEISRKQFTNVKTRNVERPIQQMETLGDLESWPNANGTQLTIHMFCPGQVMVKGYSKLSLPQRDYYRIVQMQT